MTIDGAIKYAERQAEWMNKYADVGDYKSRMEWYLQLAEWLRELKAYRDKELRHTKYEMFSCPMCGYVQIQESRREPNADTSMD